MSIWDLLEKGYNAVGDTIGTMADNAAAMGIGDMRTGPIAAANMVQSVGNALGFGPQQSAAPGPGSPPSPANLSPYNYARGYPGASSFPQTGSYSGPYMQPLPPGVPYATQGAEIPFYPRSSPRPVDPMAVAQRAQAIYGRANPFYDPTGGRNPVPPMYQPNLGGSYVAPQDMTTYRDVVNQYGYAGLAGGGPYGGGYGAPGAPGPATGTPTRPFGIFGGR